MEEKEIIQIVNKVYPKIVKYYAGDNEEEYKKGFPEIDHSWPNVYARYSQNVDMEGEDDASAEFVRKENKIYVYLDNVPDREDLGAEQKGNYYVDTNGDLVRWNGKQFLYIGDTGFADKKKKK